MKRGFIQQLAKSLKHPVVQANASLVNTINNGAFNRQSFSAMMDSWKDQNILTVLCLDRFYKIIDNRKISVWTFTITYFL
jgi:hypothetical protein